MCKKFIFFHLVVYVVCIWNFLLLNVDSYGIENFNMQDVPESLEAVVCVSGFCFLAPFDA